MLIDWFTVGAQLFNFLILIWLMKRFLYQPILNALDAREHKISAELSDAEHKKQEAQTERDEFSRKNQEFEQQRVELVKIATEEANVERLRLLNEARQEADNLRFKQQTALKNQQQQLLTEISRRTQSEVQAISRQLLNDLAGVSLEKQIIAVFMNKLQHLNTDEKQQLLLALKNSALPIQVRTAFDLQPEQRLEIERTLREIFAIDTQIEFTTLPHLISGIELRSDGQKISWSISDYLVNLEKNVNDLLQPHVEMKKTSQSEST